jgi:hypothetical protein
MAYGFNMGALVKSIINKELLLVVYIDSKLLYKYLIKLGTTREKHLIINIICLY